MLFYNIRSSAHKMKDDAKVQSSGLSYKNNIQGPSPCSKSMEEKDGWWNIHWLMKLKLEREQTWDEYVAGYVQTAESDLLLHCSCMCRGKQDQATKRKHRAFSETDKRHNDRKTDRFHWEVCISPTLKICSDMITSCLGAVEQDPFSAVLANQAGVLLHFLLITGALTFAAVDCIGHDSPPVQHQSSAHILQHPSIS